MLEILLAISAALAATVGAVPVSAQPALIVHNTDLYFKFSSKLHRNTALVLIDIQNDFINGSLRNPRAPAILPKVYDLLDSHQWRFIAASQDWHPEGHVSFASAHPGARPGDRVNVTFLDSPLKQESQGLTADHCVPGTWGAEIEDGVKSRLQYLEGFRTTVNYIKKAQNHSVDSYSAFADNQYHQFTTLNSELNLHGIETLIVTGLVTNACVRGTSIDGIKLGYEVILIEDATEASSAATKAAAIRELEGWGKCLSTVTSQCERIQLIRIGVQVMNLTDWEAANPTKLRKQYTREL